MNRILITDFSSFEEVITSLEKSLRIIKDIFTTEKENVEMINATSTWTGDTQKVIYGKYKMLTNNFTPIEESLEVYIRFLKKTLDDYRRMEENINKNAEESSQSLDVNS